jgi:hypothetical protein
MHQNIPYSLPLAASSSGFISKGTYVLHMKIIVLFTSNIMLKNYITYSYLYYPVPVKISFYLEIHTKCKIDINLNYHKEIL